MSATISPIKTGPTLRHARRPCSSGVSTWGCSDKKWRTPSSIAGLAEGLGSPERIKLTINSHAHKAAPAGVRQPRLKGEPKRAALSYRWVKPTVITDRRNPLGQPDRRPPLLISTPCALHLSAQILLAGEGASLATSKAWRMGAVRIDEATIATHPALPPTKAACLGPTTPSEGESHKRPRA